MLGTLKNYIFLIREHKVHQKRSNNKIKLFLYYSQINSIYANSSKFIKKSYIQGNNVHTDIIYTEWREKEAEKVRTREKYALK